MDGINAALSSHKRESQFEFFTALIGFGTDENLINREAELLFITKQIEVLIVFADEPKVQKLYTLVNALKKQLIVVNHGAQFNVGDQGKYVSFHTLNGTLSSYLTGKEATRYDEEAVMVSSFYDGGYSLMQSMIDAFLTKEDGLRANFIFSHLQEEFDTTGLREFLNQHQKQLLCALSGKLVNTFFEQLQDLSGSEDVKLFVTPVMLEESALISHRVNFQLIGYTAWHRGIDSEENTKLLEAFANIQGRSVDAVAALGWDTVLILFNILDKGQIDNTGFEGLCLNGAKGEIYYDAKTNHFLSGQYLMSNQPGHGEFTYTKSLDQADVLSAWQNITAAHPNGTNAGWINTYLCS